MPLTLREITDKELSPTGAFEVSSTELRSTLLSHDSAIVDQTLDPFLLSPLSRHLGKN